MTAPPTESGATQPSGLTEKVGRNSPPVAHEHSADGSLDQETASNENIASRKESSSEDKEELITTVPECSPCRRYEKGKEKVQQRHVPGIDETWMAMDLEDGVEVLWNEIHLNEAKLQSSKNYVENLNLFFDQLVQIDHPNIVKFHKHWTTTTPCHKIVFITEYMFSGSLKQFLKKCKTGNSQLTIKTWTRWCTEILGALNYLHASQLVHADISTDTIFVQFNGLIKIGRISPYTIIKSEDSESQWHQRTRFPPGFLEKDHKFRAAYDILCFGYCALEMADVKGVNGDNGSHLTPEAVEKRLQSLNDPYQKDLIIACLNPDEHLRPTAHQLLFHRSVFEVPSLKLFAAHNYICSQRKLGTDALPDLSSQLRSNSAPSSVFVAVIVETSGKTIYERKYGDLPPIDVDKLLENVRLGVDPVTVFTEHTCDAGEAARREKLRAGNATLSGMGSQICSDGGQSDKEQGASDDELGSNGVKDRLRRIGAAAGLDDHDGVGLSNAGLLLAGNGTMMGGNGYARSIESRRITQISATIKPVSDQPSDLRRELTILLRMDDRMNRQLSGQLDVGDTPENLADELVSFGLVNPLDRNLIVEKIAELTAIHHNATADGNALSPSTIVHFNNNNSTSTSTPVTTNCSVPLVYSTSSTCSSATTPPPTFPASFHVSSVGGGGAHLSPSPGSPTSPTASGTANINLVVNSSHVTTSNSPAAVV